MLNQLKAEFNKTQTENGAIAYRSTLSECLDLFSVCGALRNADKAEILQKFMRAYAEDPDTAIRILFYARDVRNGLGERRFFRTILHHLADHAPNSVQKNLSRIPEYGRYDDLLELLDTQCEEELKMYIQKQLYADLMNLWEGGNVSLLAKWLPSVNASGSREKGKKICKLLGMKEASYRTFLSLLRKRIDITETHLCQKDYTFDYENLPFKALLQYRNTFLRHDKERYEKYLCDVMENKKKMNAATLYPYELVRNAVAAEEPSELPQLAIDAAWKSLPDYTDGRNALAVIDGSASMHHGNDKLRPIDVAVSLGLYFAERNSGEFKNHFITFSSTPRLIEIHGSTLKEKAEYCMSYNEVANTNLSAVFDLILRTAIKHRLPQSEMPELIYIISDMEFDEGVDPKKTPLEAAKANYRRYGYKLPQIVYWAVSARNEHFPIEMNENGIAIFSGATPTLFRHAMSCDTTPLSMMEHVLSKYDHIRA